eukprot:13209874-Alexandrium_andersonii.AAC.1
MRKPPRIRPGAHRSLGLNTTESQHLGLKLEPKPEVQLHQTAVQAALEGQAAVASARNRRTSGSPRVGRHRRFLT